MTDIFETQTLVSPTGIAISAGLPLRLTRRISDEGLVPAAFIGPNGRLYRADQITAFVEIAAKLETSRPRAFHC